MTTETEPMAASTSGNPGMIVSENVDKWFGDFQALDNVTMSVASTRSSSFSAPPGPASPPSSAASTASRSTTPGAS